MNLTAIGISRGGKTSKIHVAVDEQGRPRKFILTDGNINDCDVACSLLENFALKGKTIIADRGYSTSILSKNMGRSSKIQFQKIVGL